MSTSDSESLSGTGLTGWRLPLLAVVATGLLCGNALWVGLEADDYLHRSVLLNQGRWAEYADSPFDMFVFLDGDPQRTDELMDAGFFQWWTWSETKLAFWRPITTLTHWLDYALWPNAFAVMHAHNLLWYALLVLSVFSLYRRCVSIPLAAALAGFCFAFDDAHAMPVGSLANRNVIVSLVFGVWTLVAHHQASSTKRMVSVYSCLGWLALLASLLSAEAGIATVAYLIAYAVFLDNRHWSSRVLSLVPYALVVILWRLVWSAQGAGVQGSDWYVDPISSPLLFLQSVFEHAPVLLLSQWLVPPAEVGMFLMLAGHRWFWYAAMAILAGVLILLIPLFKQYPEARFWGLGMLLALLPACATGPADRLLFFVGLGAMPLVGLFLAHWWQGHLWGKSRWWGRWLGGGVAGLLITVHLVAAPLLLSWRAGQPLGPAWLLDKTQIHRQLPPDMSLADQELIVVNPPIGLSALYVFSALEARNQTPPARIRCLAPTLYPLTIERLDDNTLLARQQEGMPSSLFDRVYRSSEHLFHPSQVIRLAGCVLTIEQVNAEGWPSVMRYEFSQPLEADRYRWLAWQPAGLVPFDVPDVGQDVVIIQPPNALLEQHGNSVPQVGRVNTP